MNLVIEASRLIHYDILFELIFKLRGPSYFVHTYVNMYILYHLLHLDDIKSCVEMMCALHLYQWSYYIRQLKMGDWLHHISTLGLIVPSCPQNMLRYFLLVIHLSGAINHLTIACQRNRWIRLSVQQGLYAFINTWFRLPGCVLIGGYIIEHNVGIDFGYIRLEDLDRKTILLCLTAISIIWNGIYFAKRSIELY